MKNLTKYEGSNDDPSYEIIQQQQLMAQMLQLNQKAQEKLIAKQRENTTRIEDLENYVHIMDRQIKLQQSNTRLITVNMLCTMLRADWSEQHKNKIGGHISKFSRSNKVTPQKVPHPTVPGGVNGYEPSIVKAWLIENDYQVPPELSYVD